MAERVPEPAIDLVSIRWERVQLILDARPVAGTELDPTGFRLEHDAGRGGLPPTAVTREGDVLRIRINVMQGPDLQPLDPGRWRLLGRMRPGDPAVPVRVGEVPATADPAAQAATFSLRAAAYRATPTITAERTLALDVDYETGVGYLSDEPLATRTRLRLRRELARARGAVLRALVRAIRMLAGRSGRRILFTSDTHGELTGNLRDVHDRMVERGLDGEYTLLTLFRPRIGGGRRLLDRLRLPWLLGAADVIVIDDFQPAIYRIGVDPDVRIVQLWHASGAFKTVGYSRVGKPGGPDPFSRVHKNYTYATVSSAHDVPFYAEAFGIPEARVVPTGIPRMDRFFDDATRAEGLRRAREAFPATDGRFTILFAPTFRGDSQRTATFDFDRLDYAALHAVCVEKDAVVIIRMHPFVTDPLGIPEPFRDRLLDGSTTVLDVNDLLFAVDLLITDYSSIVFEYSTLGRPMLFYAYDLDEYVDSRDFYVPFETFVPGRIVRTFAELVDAIRRDEYDAARVPAFAARHFVHLDGGSTDRVIDQLILPP